MAELKEVFEMVTKQTEPDLDSWEKQQERHRRAARNRKAGTIALVAAVIIGLIVFVVAQLPGDGRTSLTNSPTPSVAIDTTPPMGAQIVGLDGTPVQQLPGSWDGSFGLRLSPDRGTIAYYQSPNDAVLTVGVDGSGSRSITEAGNTNAGGDAMAAVSWSPDGTRLAYAYSHDIYVVNADGSGRRKLTDSTQGTGNFYPAWSPDGSTIAYWSGSATGEDGGPAAQDAEIYTIPADGGTPTRLTHNDVNDIQPTWAPDSSQIAYFSAGELWVMNADGTHQRRVYELGNVWAPAWSPDGTKIAFIAYVGNLPSDGTPIMDLRLLDLATKKETSLHVHVLTDWNGPQWVSNTTLFVNRYN